MNDEAAGYRAAVHHCWAHPRRRRGGATVPGMGDLEGDEPPVGSSPGFVVGWREGLRSASW